MAKKQKIEYVEVEGIKCEVKNPKRKAVVQYYQNSLREAIDDYIGSVDRWSESKRHYRDNLKINVIIAPFVLGWLKRPEDNDEYLVIKGYLTHEELAEKRYKEANKGKRKPRKRAAKKPAAKPAAKKPASPKKPTAPKKPSAPKKPATPKKPAVKSIAKKQDGPAKGSTTAQKKTVAKKSDSPKKKSDSPATKKAAPKRAASKTSKKK
jgi:hypothetical protein